MSTKKYTIDDLNRDYGSLTFGTALESQRLAEGWSLKEFADFLGISPSSLCDLEKERRIPSPSRAREIARKLGESEAYWIQLALQDKLREENIDLTVSVA